MKHLIVAVFVLLLAAVSTGYAHLHNGELHTSFVDGPYGGAYTVEQVMGEHKHEIRECETAYYVQVTEEHTTRYECRLLVSLTPDGGELRERINGDIRNILGPTLETNSYGVFYVPDDTLNNPERIKYGTVDDEDGLPVYVVQTVGGTESTPQEDTLRDADVFPPPQPQEVVLTLSGPTDVTAESFTVDGTGTPTDREYTATLTLNGEPVSGLLISGTITQGDTTHTHIGGWRNFPHQVIPGRYSYRAVWNSQTDTENADTQDNGKAQFDLRFFKGATGTYTLQVRANVAHDNGATGLSAEITINVTEAPSMTALGQNQPPRELRQLIQVGGQRRAPVQGDSVQDDPVEVIGTSDQSEPPDPPPPARTTTMSITTSTYTPIVEGGEIVKFLEEVEETTEEVEIEVPEPPPAPEPVYERVNWNFQFYRDWNLVTFPVIPAGVVTIADLYDHWSFFKAHNAGIFVMLDGEWLYYNGYPDEQPAGEIPLRRHMGLLVKLDIPSLLGVVRGTRLYNAERLVLQSGINLFGFHELPVGIERPSDLLDGPVSQVIVTKKGEFMLVTRAGDPGDEPLGMGQAMMVISSGPAVIDTFTGEVTDYTLAAGAPQATREGNLVTTWGAMKK